MPHFNSTTLWPNRLLNANKINCLRVDAFQDLHNLNLLSLYDNKLQTIAKGTFSPLRAIQTMYVYAIWIAFGDHCFHSELESWVPCKSRIKKVALCVFLKGIWPRTPLFVTAISSGWRIISTPTPSRPVVPAAPAPGVWQTKESDRSKARSSVVQVISYLAWHFPFVIKTSGYGTPRDGWPLPELPDIMQSYFFVFYTWEKIKRTLHTIHRGLLCVTFFYTIWSRRNRLLARKKMMHGYFTLYSQGANVTGAF